MINKEAIGKSLGKIPSGVGILTTIHQKQDAAMLASWFQQVAFEPPMVSVAVQKDRAIHQTLSQAKSFCLNLLHTNQKEIFAHFVRGFEPGLNPFEGISIQRKVTGAGVLKDAMSYLDCEIVSSTEAGDHIIYFAKVVDGDVLQEGHSMIHLRRNGFSY